MQQKSMHPDPSNVSKDAPCVNVSNTGFHPEFNDPAVFREEIIERALDGPAISRIDIDASSVARAAAGGQVVVGATFPESIGYGDTLGEAFRVYDNTIGAMGPTKYFSRPDTTVSARTNRATLTFERLSAGHLRFEGATVSPILEFD